MKNLIQTIKLRKLKTTRNEEILKNEENEQFVVLYEDGTYDRVWFKNDLEPILRNDSKKRIWYIFDMVDRINLERKVLINNIDEGVK